MNMTEKSPNSEDIFMEDIVSINERQKKDSNFSDMLDSVRRGAPTEKTLETLGGRVTDTPIPQLYSDL